MAQFDKNMVVTVKISDQASAAIKKIRQELDRACSPRPSLSMTTIWLIALQGFAWLGIGIGIGMSL